MDEYVYRYLIKNYKLTKRSFENFCIVENFTNHEIQIGEAVLYFEKLFSMTNREINVIIIKWYDYYIKDLNVLKMKF